MSDSGAGAISDLLVSEAGSSRRTEAILPLAHDAGSGLSAGVIEYLSSCKGESTWLRAQRLAALGAFEAGGKTVAWAPSLLNEIPFSRLHYYSAAQAAKRRGRAPAVEDTLNKLGVWQEESRLLDGLQAQIDGEIVYGSLRHHHQRQGVLFTDSSRGLDEFGAIFRPHFGSIVFRDENPFTRLNAAVFSGGSFLYVPAGVKVTAPLKCFMHLQARHGSQFGRTLIVLGAGAEVTFMESCSSVARDEPSLHCSVGEFVVGPEARLNYVGLQDWTQNVFNLSILRARIAAGGSVNWIDCNLGGRLTMRYPCALLTGQGASAESISIAVAKAGQHHDTGAKMMHRALGTTSRIISKSVSVGGGRAAYRGWVQIPASVRRCRNHTQCDALLVDASSRADTYPAIEVAGQNNLAQHEASVSRLGAEQMFYLRQRGLRESVARSLSVNGFVSDLVERFPVQYSLKIQRLIKLRMEGSVG